MNIDYRTVDVHNIVDPKAQQAIRVIDQTLRPLVQMLKQVIVMDPGSGTPMWSSGVIPRHLEADPRTEKAAYGKVGEFAIGPDGALYEKTVRTEIDNNWRVLGGLGTGATKPHGPSHRPDGSDPLETGPAINVDLAVNSAGTSQLFSRADHHHHLDEDIQPTWTSPHYWVVPTAEITPATGALNLTCTLPATDMTTTGTPRGLNLQITSPAGSGTPTNQSHGICAFNMALLANYTGTASNYLFSGVNSVAGTGTSEYNNPASPGVGKNTGMYAQTSATTSGYNAGAHFEAYGGARNYGVIGDSQQPKALGLNVGVAGWARNTASATRQIGVWAALFGPATAGAAITIPDPVTRYGVGAALVADTGSETGAFISLFYRGGIGIAYQWAAAGACTAIGANIGAGEIPFRIIAHSAPTADLITVNRNDGTRAFAVRGSDANVTGGASFTLRAPVTMTSGTDRYWLNFQDFTGTTLAVVKADGTWQFNGSGSSGGYITVGDSRPEALGINFLPVSTSAGTVVGGISGVIAAAYFSARRSGAARASIGGLFAFGHPGHNNVGGADSQLWGGLFVPYETAPGGNASYTATLAGGWKVTGIVTGKSNGTITSWVGGYVMNACSTALGASHVITNAHGIVLEKQTRGSTINESLRVLEDGRLAFGETTQTTATTEYINQGTDGHLDLNAATSIDANADLEMAALKYLRMQSDGSAYGGATPASTFGHLFVYTDPAGSGFTNLAFINDNGEIATITAGGQVNVDVGANYVWTGDHEFQGDFSFSGTNFLTNTIAPFSGSDTTYGGNIRLNGFDILTGSVAGAGTRFGGAVTERIAFYGATPIPQATPGAILGGFTAGAGAAVDSLSTWTGAVGASTYTVGDIVKALKDLGIFKS